MNVLLGMRGRVVAAVLIGSIAVSGCAPGMQVPTWESVTEIFVDPRSYLVDDTCAEYRRPFVEIREQQRATIQKWSGIAAASGFAIGATAIESNRLLGGLGGALLGVFLGAAAGYYFDLRERLEETDEMRAATDRDAQVVASEGDRLVSSISDLNRCRLVRIQAVEADIRADRVDAAEAKERLEAILRETRRDNRLIRSVTGGLRRQTGIFVFAAEQSGASDVNDFVARAEAYQPRVVAPQYTARRVQPVSVVNRDRGGEDGISAAVKTSSELTELQKAHLAAVDERIDTVEALLL
jgi:hypothetical protein